MSYTLKALLPGSVYEAIVQAKNRYGWNEVCYIFITFYYYSPVYSDTQSEIDTR